MILLQWVVPILIFVVIWRFLAKGITKNMGDSMSFGKHSAKIYAENETGIKFRDVAGEDEAKESLEEIVDLLHNPQKYSQIGAKLPKGALLVGPPGTGKTMLAKAVAGEAGVPFFSMSGSEFVQMFVGMGAARVRDLFKQAQEKAPCIIFIDEIDAIGKSREVSLSTNDEREQTLNQLLTEMDGFDSSKGVVIIGATNRPEVLDPALLRPGRFDRQIQVETPDYIGRKAILEVHAKKIRMSDNVDLAAIAKSTPGASGADLPILSTRLRFWLCDGIAAPSSSGIWRRRWRWSSLARSRKIGSFLLRRNNRLLTMKLAMHFLHMFFPMRIQCIRSQLSPEQRGRWGIQCSCRGRTNI